MRTSCLLALLAVTLSVAAVSAQYHDTRYLFCDSGHLGTNRAQGPWLADAGNQTFTKLGPAGSWYYLYGATMDVDNKKVVCSTYGISSASYQYRSGIYRVDPATRTLVTVLFDTNLFYNSTGPVHVNQDGDYVFTAYSRSMAGSTTTYHHRMYKTPRLGGSVTTLFTSTKFFNQWTPCYQGGQADINTGEYVINAANSSVRSGILNLSLDGSTLSTWSTGGTWGLSLGSYDGLCRDWDTGNWLSVYRQRLYQLTPGTTSETTLYKLGYPPGIWIFDAGKFDNRSAPGKRIMIGAYKWNVSRNYFSPAVCAVDASGPPYTVTAVDCDPNQKTAKQTNFPYAFGFYRGRHVQTRLTGPKRWRILISCPRFPNKAYVAAISLSGYRPPIKLNDGRRIFLRPDSLTPLSLHNALRPFFDAGPGVLDAGGEAQGALNLSRLPPLGIPMWIAIAVLDPKASNGIAYLPDTYVFRLP